MSRSDPPPALEHCRSPKGWFGVPLVQLAIFFIAPAIAHAAPPPLVIDDVTVVDVERGRSVPHATVVIDGGRIVAAGRSRRTRAAVPDHAERVDGRGRYLIPGLVDLHVHLFNNATHRPPNTWAFGLFVANGVTGVREMLTTPDELAQVREWRVAVEAGDLVAPRVLAAGIPVRGESGDDARARVRAAKAAGADFIKVFSEVPDAQWRAILDEAHGLGLAVDGHVPATVDAIEAARAGQRTAEHLMQAFEACSGFGSAALDLRRRVGEGRAVELRDQQEARVLATYERDRCDRFAAALAATRQVQVPTLVLADAESRSRADFAADPLWPLLRSDEQARWRATLEARGDDDVALAISRRGIGCAIVRSMHAAGVRLLAGTDAPMPLVYPGDSLHRELELLVDCGLSTVEALRAATIGPARMLGLDAESGAIAPGRRADLVLLRADPLRDVRNLRRIDAVVLAGRLLTRSRLDAPLASH